MTQKSKSLETEELRSAMDSKTEELEHRIAVLEEQVKKLRTQVVNAITIAKRANNTALYSMHN